MNNLLWLATIALLTRCFICGIRNNPRDRDSCGIILVLLSFVACFTALSTDYYLDAVPEFDRVKRNYSSQTIPVDDVDFYIVDGSTTVSIEVNGEVYKDVEVVFSNSVTPGTIELRTKDAQVPVTASIIAHYWTDGRQVHQIAISLDGK